MPDPVEELINNFRASDVRSTSLGTLTTHGGSTARATRDPVTLNITTAHVELELPGPPTNVWRATYVQAKIEVEGDVHLRILDGGDGVPEFAAGTSMGFEAMLSEAMQLDLECDLNLLDLREACEQGNVRAFANEILGAIGLERQWELCHGLTASIGAGWDTDFCLISAGIEGSDVRFQLPLRGSSATIEVRIPVGITIKFGLTPRGWAALGRRIGMPALRRIAGALVRLAAAGGEGTAAAGGAVVTAAEGEAALATGAGMSLGAFIGIALVSTEAGLLIRDLTVAICRHAWEQGMQMGLEMTYALAYVQTVYYGRPLARSPQSHLVPTMNRGYRRAQADVAQHSQEAVQRSLERHYLRGATIPRRADGVPVNDRQVNVIAERLASDITEHRRGY